MKMIPKQDLIIRESMSLPFGGAEIWFEELDALSVHTEVAAEKFKRDLSAIRRPSTSSLIAVNLCETLVTESLADLVVSQLISVGRIRKVAFVGLTAAMRLHIGSLLKKRDCFFAYGFFSDYEQAKVWLVSRFQ
ncbi:MAG: hypothetical protein ACERKO_13235 [Acetanaerobacterium sp.]